jgi:hypothetical protein
MRGEFIGVSSETWREIWLPLIDHDGVPEDIFCEPYRELARAPKDKPSVDALADITDHPAQLAIHEVRFEGGVLQQGFWLDVREPTPADRAPLYYVGGTGDSSSTNAQSPFNRMGQHLAFAGALPQFAAAADHNTVERHTEC